LSRVLVVDDEGLVCDWLTTVLGEAGHRVSRAVDGHQGLAATRSEDFDLVISDIEMPGMDGVEMIRVLRREKPVLKIIAMSGGDEVGHDWRLVQAERIGANRILHKPFLVGELLRLVEECI
jgi:DNA-binding response OmpR family regulator